MAAVFVIIRNELGKWPHLEQKATSLSDEVLGYVSVTMNRVEPTMFSVISAFTFEPSRLLTEHWETHSQLLRGINSIIEEIRV